jgi:hypothetical protein
MPNAEGFSHGDGRKRAAGTGFDSARLTLLYWTTEWSFIFFVCAVPEKERVRVDFIIGANKWNEKVWTWTWSSSAPGLRT